MARSLNKVTLIGNLTRDPELRYTPQGTAVCSFGLATNRQWKTDSGDKREDAEFHRIVAWQKLAELCAQLLSKGRKVFVEGRLQTRRWTAQDGTGKTTTEIVINDMIILDSKFASRGAASAGKDDFDIPDTEEELSSGESGKKPAEKSTRPKKSVKKAKKTSKPKAKKRSTQDKEAEEDIPF